MQGPVHGQFSSASLERIRNVGQASPMHLGSSASSARASSWFLLEGSGILCLFWVHHFLKHAFLAHHEVLHAMQNAQRNMFCRFGSRRLSRSRHIFCIICKLHLWPHPPNLSRNSRQKSLPPSLSLSFFGECFFVVRSPTSTSIGS